MNQHPTRDGHTIAAAQDSGDVVVLAQIEHHDLTSPSPDMVRAGNRALLRAAVARQIICPFTDTVLDIATAVHITIPERGTLVMTAAHWDERGPGFLAARPGTEVIEPPCVQWSLGSLVPSVLDAGF